MIKAVTIPLCVSVLLATTFLLPAQTDTSAAINEAIRRQADRITLQQKLIDARAAEGRRDLVVAAKLYSEAWTLIEGIGSGVDQEAAQTVAGVTSVRMQLAKAAQKRGDYRDADTHIKEVLRVNRQDTVAQQFKAANDQMLAQQIRSTPHAEVLEKVPAIRKEKEEADILVQDGRLLYELGKYDEADAKLKRAKELDPRNSGANYYLSAVQQARFRRGVDNRNVSSTTRIVDVEKSWADSTKRLALPQPNPMARTNLIFTGGPARQSIMAKLDSIHLDTVLYEGLPLSEVVRSLDEQAKRRDPEKRGINFLINPSQSAARSVITTPVQLGGVGGIGGGGGGGFPTPTPFSQQPVPLTDPTTGLPIPQPETEQIDINTINIKLNPALHDIRLADALDAIVTVADHPIKYSIKDFAVEFSLRGNESAPLVNRRFKVDPNTFIQGLESVGGLDFSSVAQTTTSGGGGQGGGGGGGGGGQGQQSGAGIIPRVTVTVGRISGGQGGGQQQQQQIQQQQGGQGTIGGGLTVQNGPGIGHVTRMHLTSVIQSAVIAFFRSVGVFLDPPKNVFFNDREGSLWVRATTEDLDIIENAIQTLNVAPPQVNIRVKFVEVTQSDRKALGFDWILGNVLLGGKAALSGGTQPSFTGVPTAANPEGTFPGSGLFGTTTAPNGLTDGVLSSGLRNTLNAPAVGSLTGILTDPQFKMVIRALQQRDGVDELSDGQVTTLSGRQAQFQAVDLRYIVTTSGVQQTGGGGGGGVAAGGGGVAAGNAVVATAIIPGTSVVPLGPTIDVIPYVSADGYTIQMTLIPTLVQFLGYDDPGQFIIQAQSGTGAGGVGAPLTATLPLPRFRLRQVTTSCSVWDGQTVVLGGLISDNVTRVKDQIPVFGDLPLVGRLFRSEQNQSSKQNLLIFVSPTIIDPAGNRVHNDEDLPFAQHTLPPQPLHAEHP